MAAPRRSGAAHGIAGRGRSPGDTRVARGARRRRRARRPGARAVPARARRRARAAHRRRSGARGHDAVRQHDPAAGRARSSRATRRSSAEYASIVRWNAIATVLHANKESSELGGHIASYQSAATLYEVGFNHFWHAPTDEHGGDLVYMQGHSSPGRLRARVPRGPAHRGAAAQLPQGGRRQRALARTRTRG